MKLILCESCGDVLSLRMEARACFCGASGGRYLADRLNAEIWGACVPLGFANWSFNNALGMRPQSGMGRSFEAFVIPVECDTAHHVKTGRRTAEAPPPPTEGQE